MSGLSGLQVGNSKVKQYQEAIEKGGLLVMVDLPKERIDDISKVIVKHHPNAEFEGIEPILQLFRVCQIQVGVEPNPPVIRGVLPSHSALILLKLIF